MSEESSGRYGSVKNPLTVIAIFAGIAELTATIALPQLEKEIQAVFVWFVMVFPTVLVLLFFFVLWNRHQVLYAPSDYLNESNFMMHWPKANRTNEDIVSDLEPTRPSEVSLPDDTLESVNGGDFELEDINSLLPSVNYREFISKARRTEKLAISYLSKKLNVSFSQHVAYKGLQNFRYDAVAIAPSGPILAEVKIITISLDAVITLRRELDRLAALVHQMGRDELLGARFTLLFVVDGDEGKVKSSRTSARLKELIEGSNLPVKIDVDFISLTKLEKVSEI